MTSQARRKTETHDRIVRKAAQEFRRRGLQGIGIADLMSEVGLTHGGFYAHFKGKDTLVAEASICATEENVANLVAVAESADEGNKVDAILRFYLDPAHRDDPAHGCVDAALAGEIARQPRTVRKAFTKALEAKVGRIANYMPGDTDDEKLLLAMFLMSGMVGALSISRAISDPVLSGRWLDAARRHYSAVFRKMIQRNG